VAASFSHLGDRWEDDQSEPRFDFIFSDGPGWPAGDGGITASSSTLSRGTGVRGIDFPLSLAARLLPFPIGADDNKSLKNLFMAGVRETRMSAQGKRNQQSLRQNSQAKKKNVLNTAPLGSSH